MKTDAYLDTVRAGVERHSNDGLTGLERALGGKLERLEDRIIPGVEPIDGQSVVYYQDDKRTTSKKLFMMLFEGLSERRAKFGGSSSGGCSILTPDKELFRAMYYHGDMEGWRLDIEAGARRQGLLLAWFHGECFKLPDGREYSLTDCDVTFE